MIVGGQTGARAQLSSTIIHYHAPFDQGFSFCLLFENVLNTLRNLRNLAGLPFHYMFMFHLTDQFDFRRELEGCNVYSIVRKYNYVYITWKLIINKLCNEKYAIA